MGKHMYNSGKIAKEKERQRKQMEKTSKRRLAKQNRDNIKSSTPNEDAATT